MKRKITLIAIIISLLTIRPASSQIQSPWEGRILTTYGNSITAIGNGNQEAPYKMSKHTPWQILVADKMGFSKHYGRGVGGQRFTWNENTWWANEDGSYNNRPNGKNQQPENTSVHLGAFSSWDRITTMIPKESDLILIMGGTNDWGQPIGEMTFDVNNRTDKQWAESEYFTGDFDLNCFKGGVASTILKMQTWCPDAVIVLVTPLAGRGKTPGKNAIEEDKRNNMVTSQYAQAIKEVGFMMGIPVIDLFGRAGINNFNRSQFIKDTVHPYGIGEQNKGNEAIARVIIGELMRIMPQF